MSRQSVMPSPMGRLTFGHDPRIVGIAVKQRIKDYGPHAALVDRHGRVFIRPTSDVRSELMASRHPSMFAGIFNNDATSKDIADSLVFVYTEQMDREFA